MDGWTVDDLESLPEDGAARRRSRFYQPHEVVLAIEIVSPTSLSMDRITEPALFAAAGIPYYWRIETTDGIQVHAHRSTRRPGCTGRPVCSTPSSTRPSRGPSPSESNG